MKFSSAYEPDKFEALIVAAFVFLVFDQAGHDCIHAIVAV